MSPTLELGASPPQGPLAPRPAAGTDISWSANDKANGSSAVSVKQSLSNFLDNLLDTRVGADMTVARPPQTLTESQLLANGGSLPQSSGTAWAAITAPGVGSIWDKTAVEARLDPSQEQSKLGTSLSKSLSLDEQYSLSLQDDYSLIEQGIVPVPGIISRPVAQLRNRPVGETQPRRTGTSFTAGQSLSSTDDKWLRHVGAEQKLFGGVSISGLDRRNAARHHEQEHQRRIQAKLVTHAPHPLPMKDRALPHIGPDAVKIGRPDGPHFNFVVRGTIRARSMRNRGTADECHHSF